MTRNQKTALGLIIKASNEIIGGLENEVEDYQGMEEARVAQEVLDDHETICSMVFCEVRFGMQKYLRFVTNKWIKEQIEKRVTSMGY